MSIQARHAKLRRRYRQTRVLTRPQMDLVRALRRMRDHVGGGTIAIAGDREPVVSMNRHGDVRWHKPQRWFRR